MAAPARKMVGDSEDSSSSDDEELRRCQEAVWEAQPLKTKDAGSDVKQSKRIVVAEHEHDGNELQVTRGFQTHVAKKLDHLLDSLISEKQPETSTCVESAKCGDQDDEGFRLFSTSVPGQTAEEAPAPVRRRPIPSSSDSDSDMEARLKEAAVSIKDLLPASLLPLTESKEEIPCTEKTKKKKKKKVEEGEENCFVKKKKKLNQEETEKVDSESAHNGQNNGDHNDSDNAQTQVKVKKKKKKKRKSTEGDV